MFKQTSCLLHIRREKRKEKFKEGKKFGEKEGKAKSVLRGRRWLAFNPGLSPGKDAARRRRVSVGAGRTGAYTAQRVPRAQECKLQAMFTGYDHKNNSWR